MKKLFRGIGVVFAWLFEANEIVVDHLARCLSVVALVAAGAFAAWFVREVHASRNSSGTMSGISGPYTSGTVISSSILNARFADIETEITDSASRSGKGGFTAPVRGADGVVTAPTFAFTSETGTGLYRIGSSDLGLSINQTKTGEWTANGYRTANGAVATPSLSFFNDTGSGLYRIGSNNIGFAINGASVAEWAAGAFSVGGAVPSSASTPALSIRNSSNQTNFYMEDGRGAAGNKLGRIVYDGSSLSGGTGNLSKPGWQFQNVGDTGAFVSGGLTIYRDGSLAGVTIGANGAAIGASKTATLSWTPGAITAPNCATNTLAITNIAFGDTCMLAAPGALGTSVAFTACSVGAAGSVNLAVCSFTNVTPPSGTYTVRTFQATN